MNGDLEERMRQAIATGPLEPSAATWKRVASRRSSARPRRQLVVAAIGLAAGIAAIALVRYTLQNAAPVPQHATTRVAESDASFFAPQALFAQSPTYPLMHGDGPRGVRLRGGHWTYIYVKNGTDTLPSRLTYTIRRGVLNGVPAWSLVTDNSNAIAWRRIDSLWATADSLRPLMRITAPGGTRLEQTFRNDEVLSGYFSPSGYVNWTTTVLTDTTRFNEASIIRWADVATLFQTTAITAEWKRSIPVSAAAEYGAIRPFWLNLSVEGEERLVTAAGTFDCWKIRLGLRLEAASGVTFRDENGPIEESQLRVWFWVSKDRGWLIQQGHDNDRNGTSTRSVLVEARED